MIRDLEELLLSIKDRESRAYMQEAVKCYNVGAYRAAVVLSVAAGMDGLRSRLAELAGSGGASQDIKDAHKHIERTFDNQDPYELHVIQASYKHASMLTLSESEKLQVILKTRHLCAHPSGHAGTPEEARDAISTIVDLILSRPALTGMTAIGSIIDRLHGSNFFPNRNIPSNNRTTVETEIQHLNPALYNTLAIKLVAELSLLAGKVLAGDKSADVGEARVNFAVFLANLTKVSPETQMATWNCLKKTIEEPATTTDALYILSYDSKGLYLVEPLVRERAIGLIRRNLTSTYARRAARDLRHQEVLSLEEINEIIQAASKAFFPNDQVTAVLVKQATELEWPEVAVEVFDKVIERCGSGSFSVANPAIRLIQELTAQQSSTVSPSQQLKYVLTVAENAGRHWSAAEATIISEKGLGPRSAFLDQLMLALQEPETVIEENTSWEHVAMICEASARPDILPALIDLFNVPVEKAISGLNMLAHLRSNAEVSIATRATQLHDRITSDLSNAPDSALPDT